MHILQLVPSLEVGGVERGVLDLAKGLIARGHRVSVVSSGGALVDELCRLGAVHHAMPVDQKSPWSAWRTIPALCQLVRDTKVDLIHARSRVPAWIGYAAARRSGIPFVTTAHGFYKPHPASRVMGWGRVVIVPSKALGRYLIDQFHVPPERLRVIPRGVDLAQFPFRPAPPGGPAWQGELSTRTSVQQGGEEVHGVSTGIFPETTPPTAGWGGVRGHRPHQGRSWRFGVIGRITALKGHEVAIRALHQLTSQHLPVSLCVIGDPPWNKPQLRPQLIALAETLGVEPAIEWCGTRRDIPECLASLDGVLVPSTYPESFGRSVVEAQAVGVPVIASRLGGLAELIDDGQTGWLVPPGDAAALANAIRRVIEDEPGRRRVVQQARERVEREFPLERMVDDTLAVYHDCLTKPRVAIWKLSALGDLILVTPSLRAIRRQFPESPITLIVGRPVYEAVARCPYVNDVVVYDSARKDRTLAGKVKLVRRLKRAGFNLSIDLQNSRLTHLLAWLSGIPVRIGYRRRWGWLLNRAVPLPRGPMPPVGHQHYLLRHAGVSPDGDALELWPSEQDEQRVAQLLQSASVGAAQPLVGLHIGGSRRWRTKRWDVSRWAALCDRLAARGAHVVVTGSAADQPLAEQFLRLTRAHPIMAVGNTRLMELACVIRRCQVFVTTDSAPLHVAAAMGTPTIALFGPTDPARHAPASAAVRVIKKTLPCSPCYSTWCRTITHACMNRIQADEVATVVGELLQTSA